MADAYLTQLQALEQQAESQSGEALLKTLHEIVELAKANSDGEALADFAERLLHAAWHEGRFDYEMLGFGELKSLYERDANYADLRAAVLWYFKWIGESLPEHVEVSAERIEELFDNMEKFYRAEKEGLRPVYALRYRAAAAMGRKDEAEKWGEQWRAAEEQESDDCVACQTHMQFQTLLDLGRVADALKAAQPIIDGEQACDEVPATTFSRLLLPLMLTGDVQTAMSMALFSRRQIRKTPKLVGFLADHVMFWSIFGATQIAWRLMIVMLVRAEQSMNSQNHFLIARAAWIFFARLRDEGVSEIHFPRKTRLGASGAAAPIEQAIAHYESRARQLAAQFDARNGTDRFKQRVDSLEQIIKLRLPTEEGA